MLFSKREDIAFQSSAVTPGQNLTIEIQRDFHLESLEVVVSGTISTLGTLTADGLAALVRRIQLTVNDGNSRNPVDITGRGLLEYNNQVGISMDRASVLAINQSGTGAFELRFPVFFAHPQLIDPLRAITLLPTPRYASNPTLNLQIGALADVGATFAITGNLSVRVVRRMRVVDMPSFVTRDTELYETSTIFGATGPNQNVEIPVPGFYTGILARTYNTAGARADIVGNAFVTLTALGTNFRRVFPSDLLAQNDFSVDVQRFPFSYYLDFLTDTSGDSVMELTSLFDANVYATTGAKPYLQFDINTTGRVNTVFHRVFGDLSAFSIQKPKS
jgi:hypothetical protein